MTVWACVKWVARDGDDRFGGISPADQAAVEWSLRIGAARGEDVAVVTLGPVGAEAALRDALACGVDAVVRIDGSTALASAAVAGALAGVVRGASVVCGGDVSLDRGTGSVPAFLAAELDAAQALGLVDVAIEQDRLVGLRRLDGGRRERVALRGDQPCVLSVEGATATLRRAPLSAALGVRGAMVPVVAGPRLVASHEPMVRPYRPRARALAAPAGATALDRVRSLLGSGAPSSARTDPLVLDPPAAADRILAALREWGYLDGQV